MVTRYLLDETVRRTILELNPFPFIKTSYDLGKERQWELEIGSFPGDERWKTWEGSISEQNV